MTLFLAKTLEKHPAFTAQIPEHHLALIQDWQAMIRNGALKDEKSAHPSFIQKVLV